MEILYETRRKIDKVKLEEDKKKLEEVFKRLEKAIQKDRENNVTYPDLENEIWTYKSLRELLDPSELKRKRKTQT